MWCISIASEGWDGRDSQPTILISVIIGSIIFTQRMNENMNE